MLNTIVPTVNQLINMFFFVIVGFVMRRRKIGGEGVGTTLSTLLVNIFMPALTFSSFSENFRLKELSENMAFFVAGVIALAATFPVAKILAEKFGKTSQEKDIYIYSFLIPNLGYMGIPLIEAVYGNRMLFYMMVFTIPYNIVIYTYGLYILNPNRKFSLKKILSPSFIAMILGIIAGIAEIKLPTAALSIINSAKGGMAISAMILTGFVLAATDIKPLFRDFKLYLAAIIRGLAISMAALGICLLFKVDTRIMVVMCATLAMPMGLNSIVFPEAYGGDGLTGAKTSFMSNVLSIVTIPIVFFVLGLFQI